MEASAQGNQFRAGPLSLPIYPKSLGFHSDVTQIAPSLERFSASAFRIARFSSVGGVQKPICPDYPSFRHTPPVVFTWPSISLAYAGAGLGRRSSIRLRIFWNSFLGTATSANWNVT